MKKEKMWKSNKVFKHFHKKMI